ncbi:hypothetical protein [Roseovarius mucosus]
MIRNGMMLAALAIAGCTVAGPQMVARLGADPVLSGEAIVPGAG